MSFLLSIRTVFPRKGGRIWYDDQRHVHQQIFAGEEELDYAFMGRDPEAPDNVWLREAAEHEVPLIYFLGVSPGRYQAIIPTFVVDWDPRRLTARIAFGELAGATATATAPDPVERRYPLGLVSIAASYIVWDSCSPLTIIGARSAPERRDTARRAIGLLAGGRADRSLRRS